MNAWLVQDWCTPEQMQWTDLPLPAPGPSQVRVKVAAAALNFLDTLMIGGRYQERPPLPFAPGVELSGTVDGVGEGVGLTAGDRVCGLVPYGAFAQYACVDAAELVAVPQGVDLVQAAALPVVYGTAHHALAERGRLQAGETLLVLAAAGGVGLATVQLGRALGLRVLAAAGGPDKCALCLEHGAELAFDYRDPAWAEQVKATTGGRGVDAVFDPVGGAYTAQALRLLAFGGRLLIVGFAAGSIPEIPANRLLLKDLSALGVVWGAWRRRNRPAAAKQMTALFDLWQQGAIAPLVSQRRPLSEAPQAIADLGARRTTGKVLLIPEG
ncbi:NADPH:quinone oxidoreductase family protein [Immundisolibacter sp.]